MKHTLLYMMLGIIVMALTSCHDDPAPFDKQLLEGDWVVEIPEKGTTENYRSEEGGTTEYEMLMVVLRFNPLYDSGYWMHIFVQNGEMVNFNGFGRQEEKIGNFDFTVDSDGHITISHFLEGTPHPQNIRYADGKIFAEINGQTIIFTHPSEPQAALLSEVMDILMEEGEIGGAEDTGNKYGTDISDKNATTPARAPRRR